MVALSSAPLQPPRPLGLGGVVATMLRILSASERRQLALLLPPVLATGVLEAAGVASIIPFLGLLADPNAIEKSKSLSSAYAMAGTETREGFFFLVGVVVLVTVTLGNVTQAFTTYALLRFSWMRNHTLSVRLLESYLHRPYTFFVQNNSSDLAKNLLSEVQQVVTGIVVQGLQLCARLFLIVLVGLSLVLVDPVMAIGVTLGFGGVYGGIYMAARRMLGRLGQERVDSNAARYKIATEILAGIKELKLLGLERTLLDSYARPSEIYADRWSKYSIIGGLPRFALETLAFGGVLVIVLWLLWAGRPLQAALPVLGLYAFAAYRLLPAIQVVFTGVTTVRFNLAALATLARGMETSLAANVGDDRRSPPMAFSSTMELRSLSYCYPSADRDALAGVNLRVRKGEWIALVGPTGSGKTTLVDLILGLLEPTSGGLFIDGIEVADARAWQRNVGYVPQQIFLADDSVRRNIAFGVPDAEIDQARVEEAARIAQVHDFVSRELPGSYDAVVGERGVRLSGGQRQRLGIARALYRRPLLLVLDEATSALDGATEAAFFVALRHELRDRTVVSIAHRLSTTSTFDRVVLIQDGKAAAEGRPDDAIQARGPFAVLHGR
ncbi:MAG: ABC transporter ATP-binding protein [Deltaproteobacteria bacterium]|nr:ABC transporter ATP-binding protein [Deltaproteobacteria bacterium]